LHLIVGISIVNVYIIYQSATNKKIKITRFGKLLVTKLLRPQNNSVDSVHRNNTHNLVIRKSLKEKQLDECVFYCKTSRGTLDRQTV